MAKKTLQQKKILVNNVINCTLEEKRKNEEKEVERNKNGGMLTAICVLFDY